MSLCWFDILIGLVDVLGLCWFDRLVGLVDGLGLCWFDRLVGLVGGAFKTTLPKTATSIPQTGYVCSLLGGWLGGLGYGLVSVGLVWFWLTGWFLGWLFGWLVD